jgi:tetratricopeptide (TPR) repeat protein
MRFQFLLQASSAIAACLLTCTAVRAASSDDLIKIGDALDAKFKEAEALDYYLPVLNQQPKNTKLLLSIARQYRHLMTDAPIHDEKIRLGGIALAYSHRAARIAPNNSDAQLDVAISYGKMLPFQGIKEQVEASPLIKIATDKAIKLDPRNDTAWHILGRWQRELASVGRVKRALAPLFYGKLPPGSNEVAVSCFERALEINPNRLMHYIELGLTYAQMGQKDDARRLIAKGLSMPDKEKDDPETKQHGRDALAKFR